MLFLKELTATWFFAYVIFLYTHRVILELLTTDNCLPNYSEIFRNIKYITTISYGKHLVRFPLFNGELPRELLPNSTLNNLTTAQLCILSY